MRINRIKEEKYLRPGHKFFFYRVAGPKDLAAKLTVKAKERVIFYDREKDPSGKALRRQLSPLEMLKFQKHSPGPSLNRAKDIALTSDVTITELKRFEIIEGRMGKDEYVRGDDTLRIRDWHRAPERSDVLRAMVAYDQDQLAKSYLKQLERRINPQELVQKTERAENAYLGAKEKALHQELLAKKKRLDYRNKILSRGPRFSESMSDEELEQFVMDAGN